MKKLKRDQILTPEILKDCSYRRRVIDQDINNGWFILNYKTKDYLVERFGECNYKKCKNACCKFFQINHYKMDEYYKYAGNFCNARRTKYGLIFPFRCKQLLRSGKCKVWGTKKFSNPCSQFPLPTDKTYYEVYKKCSFRFRVIGELITNLKKR